MKGSNGKRAVPAASRSKPRCGREQAGAAKADLNPRKKLVKEQLVTAAAEVFAAKGYGNTNIGDIARSLGLGRSAVYHYFKSKVEILHALIEQEALQPYNSLIAIARLTDLTPSERLHRCVVDFVLRRLTGGARLVVLNRIELEMPAEIETVYTQRRRQILDIFVRLIAEGIRAGEFNPIEPKIAAFTVLGMANWTSRWYSPMGKKSAEEIAEIVADFGIAGLRGAKRRQEIPDSIGGAIRVLKRDIETLERLAR
ncbi:MAG: TetR/AcrR family transcriptional regulator [Proteobacteria bacterium]|nr:TetR/AcrR family transcriptional regulator [Pseudomonadota bacterium]